MKTIKLFVFVTIALCFTEACDEKPKTTANIISKDINCPVPKEFLENGDTINKTLENGIKVGHWISFDWIIPKGKEPNAAAVRVVRAKLEEGFYKNNKKEGFWKFYDKDNGTFKDSVEYKNDIAVTN